jgi:hypothetical protein
MPKCTFQYQAGDGQFTERAIRDWSPSSLPDSIDAYCELRREQRTFNLKKMSHLVDLETGEIIADPWFYFGLTSNSGEGKGRQSLDALTWEALPAIRALKFFIITTRGLSKRERLKLVQFVEEVCNVSPIRKKSWKNGYKRFGVRMFTIIAAGRLKNTRNSYELSRLI